MRRTRREAARHTPRDRHSMFSPAAQTFQARWGLLHGRQSPGRPRLLEAGAHPDAAPDERSPRTTGPAASDLSSEPLPRSSFLPFVCLHVKGAPARCKVLLRPGARHLAMVARRAEVSSAARPPSRPANSAGESGVVATRAAGGG